MSDAQDTAHRTDELVDSFVRSQVAPSLRGLPEPGEVRGTTQWTQIATDLSRASDEVLRPLSHSLWQSSYGVGLRRPFSWVWRIVSTQDFRPGLVSAIFVAGFLSPTLSDYGWWPALIITTLAVGLIFGVFSSANAIMARTRHRAVVFIGAVVLIQVIPLLPWPATFGEAPVPTVGERVVATIASVLLILITSAVGVVREVVSLRTERWQDEVDRAEVAGAREASEVEYALRAAAAHLHGTVQARLSSAALAIQAAVQEHRWEEAREALARVRHLLDETPMPASIAEQGLGDAIDSVCQPWQSIGEVRVSCAVEQEPDEAARRAVTRIVDAAVTNAFRHGRASFVEVSVRTDGTDLVLEVSDDGTGVEDPSSATRGLGLTQIDSLTHGRWALSRVDGSTKLQARVS